jgi:hypothetical protein
MATYHFADNAAPYAHALAIQGNDSWNGLHKTFQGGSDGPKRNPANFNPTVLQAGDSVLFAQGGGWSNDFNALFENPASSSMARTNMITFDSYDPETGATGVPWFKSTGNGFMFGGFGGTGAPTHGGYLIQNLKFEGPVPDGFDFTEDSFGVRLNQPLKWVIVRNCEIYGFKAGVVAAQATDCASSYILVENCEIHHCGLAAIEGFANWFLVQNNNIHHCGELNSFTHGVYCGSGAVECTAGTFRHNWLHTNNVDPADGICKGGNFTVRGKIVGLHIEYNRVHNEDGLFASNTAAIAVKPGYPATVEYHFGVRVIGNDTSGVQSHISLTSVPGVIVRGNSMRDNGTVAASCPAVVGIGMPIPERDAEDVTADSGARCTYNTFTSDNPRNGTQPFWFGHPSGDGAGAGLVLDYNTVALGSGAGSSYAFTLDEVGTFYDSISYNTLSGGAGWNASHASLAAFEAYYGALSGTTCTGNSGP